jgi:hypothetical protein
MSDNDNAAELERLRTHNAELLAELRSAKARVDEQDARLRRFELDGPVSRAIEEVAMPGAQELWRLVFGFKTAPSGDIEGTCASWRAVPSSHITAGSRGVRERCHRQRSRHGERSPEAENRAPATETRTALKLQHALQQSSRSCHIRPRLLPGFPANYARAGGRGRRLANTGGRLQHCLHSSPFYVTNGSG